MHEGKLTNEQLESLIFNKINKFREETVVGPGIGKDCAVLDLARNYLVISSDPITGTEKNIGKLCVNVCCNDIAAAGAEPVAIMVTCLIPPQAKMNDIKTVMDDLMSACEANNIDLIGGHTEISSAVNRFVLNGTAIGKKEKKPVGEIEEGYELIMSKSAGLEGVGIIACERSEEIAEKLGADVFNEAMSFLDMTSVVKEGMIGSKNGAVVMHDATEGGILGGAWEMAEGAGLGVEVWADEVPITEAATKICSHYRIDPLRLISSGVMLFAAPEGAPLKEALRKNNVGAAIIGKFKGKDKIIIKDNKRYAMEPPASDELYKVIGCREGI